jgi:hypothetical protein
MATAHASTTAKDSPFCDSRQNMKKLEDALSSEDAMHAPLHEIERMLETQGREVLRALMQAHFDLRSAQERSVEVRDDKGTEHGDVRRGSRKVETKSVASPTSSPSSRYGLIRYGLRRHCRTRVLRAPQTAPTNPKK